MNCAKVTSKSKQIWQGISDLKAQYSVLAKKISELNKVKSNNNDKIDHLKFFKNMSNNVKKQIYDADTTDLNDTSILNNSYFLNVTSTTTNRNYNNLSTNNVLRRDPSATLSTPNAEIPIFTIKENSNQIVGFDTNAFKNGGEIRTFTNEVVFPETSKKNVFYWNSRIVQVKTQLYITGGHDDFNNTVKTCMIYESLNNCLTEVKNMNSTHWGHSVIYVPPKFIFVISGSYTRKCEYYDIVKKVWTNISEINTWRMDPTSFIYNNLYLYIFGGWNNSIKTKDPFVEKIERIKLFSPINESLVMTTNKWEYIKLSNSSNLNHLKKTCMGLIRVNDNKLLLLGGDTSDYLKDTLFDNTNSVSPGLGASKIKYHTSVVEVKINYLGGCEIELLKNSSLEAPSCFTLIKNFTPLGSIYGNMSVYGCFNHMKDFVVLENKDGNYVNLKSEY